METVAEKKYIVARSVEEALDSALHYRNDFKYVAGGTDLMVNRQQGNETSSCLIDISGIEELRKIAVSGDEIRIGSLVTLHELQSSKEINEKIPVLAEAAFSVATPVIRKTATLGGNILCENRCVFYNQSEFWRDAVGYCLKCNGDICIATGGKKNCFSKFVSDTAVPLIALNSRIVISDSDGDSEVLLEEIYSGDGVNSKKLKPTGIIREIIIPYSAKNRLVFRKLRKRESMDFTSLTTTVSRSADGNIKVVMGGVDPKPVIVSSDEVTEEKALIDLALKRSRIVDNDVFTREYRRKMIRYFLEESFRKTEG